MANEVKIKLAVDGAAAVNNELKGVGSGLNDLKQQAHSMGETAGRVGGQLRNMLAGVGLAVTIKEFVSAADAMTLIDARLKLATGSARDFAQAQADVYRIAQANNVGLQETAQLYTKLSEPVKRLGGTTREVGAIVDAFATSLRVGGASTQEAASATLQFAQAMGSGKLQGDEFRAIAEASPRFMKALADGMNVPIDALKEMGTEGKLTADVVGNALVKSLGQLKDEAQTLPDTVGGSLTRLKNDVLLAVDDINKNTGLTLGLADLAEGVRTQLLPAVKGELTDAFKTVGEFITEHREKLGEVWVAVKAIVGDVWGLAKSAGSVLGFLADWALKTDQITHRLEVVRMLIAGFKDGVEIIGASFAHVGSEIMQVLVAPLVLAGKAAAAVASVFDKELSARISAKIASIEQFTTAGQKYAAGVVQNFADGKTALGALNAEMEKSARDSKQMAAALGTSTVSAADNARELKNMGEKAKEAAAGYKTLHGSIKVDGKAAEEAKKLADAGKALAASLLAVDAGLSGNFAEQWAKLSAAYRAGGISLDILIKAQAKLLEQQPAMQAQEKATAKLFEEAAKESEAYAKAQDKAIVAANAEVTAAQAAYDAHGKLKSVIAEEELARLENNRAIIAGHEDTTVLDARIAAKKRLIDVLRNGEVRDAAEKSARDAAAEWQKASDQIQQSLSDALMNAFTAGKGFGKTFVNSIKAMFNTMVLRPVISAIVSPVAGAVTGAMGFSGAANAGSSLGGVGNLAGLFGAGGLSGSLTAGAGWLTGATTLGGSLSAGASLIGTGTAAGSLAGAGMIAGALAPIGIALAGVYALAKNLDHSGTPHTGGGSGYSASGGLKSAAAGDVFDGGYTGLTYSDSASQMTTQIVQGIVGILDSTAVAFGKTAGYEAATSFADDSSKDGAWGALVIKHLDTTLTDWSRYAGHGEVFSDGAAGSAEYLAAISTDVRKALDGIGLPEWAKTMLDGLGEAPSLDQLASVVSEINATQVVLQSLGASVKVFAGLSGDAVLNIINASGGLQAFGASLGAYYENFYSEQEKFDAKLQSLNTRLQDLAAGGAFADSSDAFFRAITEPTRENFRKLIEAQDLTTASGQSTYAALLGLSGVVAELTPVAEKAAEAVQTLGEVATTLADVQKLFDSNARTILNSAEYSAYRIQQIQATLGAAGMSLSAEQITHATREQVLAGYQQALAAGNLAAASAILNVVDALAEVSTGFQGVTAESTSAAVAIQQVVTTLADVQTLFGSAARTLLNDVQYTAYQVAQIQATLGSVGINVTAADIQNATREQVLAGLGEMMAAGNLDAARAILSVVDALSQVSSGFQTVAATASNAAAVMQQRAGLESTLLNLTGNTAAIRERELAALDASNRGLQQHIYAIQDAQQAVQDAQQAVSAATSAYQAQESAISSLQSAAQRWIGTMNTASSLLDQISGSLGGAGGNREAALWATVNGAGDIDARLSAAQELYGLITQTARTEAAAQDNALSNAKALLEYGQRLRDYVQGLKTGDLSTLTPAQKVAEALAQYQTTLAAAQGGDQTALGNLQGVADTYLRLAREFDPASYTASVFTSVTNALDSLGAGLVSQNSPQVTLLQAQLDAAKAASSSANTLSAEQVARLQTLQGVVQDLYAQAGAQSAIANAQVSSAQANLQALSAAQLAAQQNLAAQQQAVVTAQQAATAYMATLADVAVADPVPDILRSLPEGIAAALAPLLNANPASTAAAAAATTAARAQIIRDYAATLPQDETGARMLYDAAVANGVSSAELDAAMGFAPGSWLAWAVSHNLPAFAQGTNYVPHDMVAQIHQGEAIIPARYNPAGGGNAELAAKLEAVLAELKALREQNNAGHQLGAMATHENTQQITRATVEAASKARHTQHLQQRAALA